MNWERIGWLTQTDFLGKSSGRALLGVGKIFPVLAILLAPLAVPELKAAAPTLDQAKTLEESVWLASPDQLASLEKATVRLVQENPKSAFGHYLLAELYLREFKQTPSQLKLLKQASELGQQAIELAPNRDYGYIISAQVLDLMGYTENAIAVLDGDSGVPIQNSWRLDFLRGQLLTGHRPEAEVLQHFTKSLQTGSEAKNIVIPYVIATLQANGRGSRLVQELKDWNTRYPHRLFDLSLALALSDNQQFAEAHTIYQQVLKQNPFLAEALINDGIILYTQLKQHREGLTNLERALKNGLDSTHLSIVKAHQARIHLDHLGKYAEARKLFAEAIVAARNPMEWLSFAHKSYEKSQRLAEFVDLIEDLRTDLGGSSYLYALQGEVLSESLALHERAIESFSSAILLDPGRSEFYNGMGLAYYRSNRLDKALVVFAEASKIDPQDATSKYNEACVLAIMGRSTEALGSLKTAIELDPRLQQTAQTDKDFVSIRMLGQFKALTDTIPVAATSGP